MVQRQDLSGPLAIMRHVVEHSPGIYQKKREITEKFIALIQGVCDSKEELDIENELKRLEEKQHDEVIQEFFSKKAQWEKYIPHSHKYKFTAKEEEYKKISNARDAKRFWADLAWGIRAELGGILDDIEKMLPELTLSSYSKADLYQKIKMNPQAMQDLHQQWMDIKQEKQEIHRKNEELHTSLNQHPSPDSYHEMWKLTPGDDFAKAQTILRDYTKNGSGLLRFFSGHWNRHHVAEVSAILCDDKITTIDDLKSALLKIQFQNPSGSLLARVAFIFKNTKEREMAVIVPRTAVVPRLDRRTQA